MQKSYSGAQIALHWLTVIAVFIAWIGHDGMEAAWRALARGGTADQPVVHIVAGLTVLVLTLVRIVLRLRHGAPDLPEDLPPVVRWSSIAAHTGLYLLLILMPASGAAAWFLGQKVPAEAHGLMFNIFALLIFAHIGAALWHRFVRRDGVMQRMLRAG